MNLGDSCSLCKQTAILACSRCGEPYCSPGCQKTDWIRHRHFCIAMPPLVSRSEMKYLYDEITNAAVDPEIAEMMAYSTLKERKSSLSEKSENMSKLAAKMRAVIPPAPLKDDTLQKRVVNIVKCEKPAEDELKWTEKVSMTEMPRKEVEVVVHYYDHATRDAWLVLAKDKKECNAMMIDLNKAVKTLHPAPAEMIHVGQLFAVQFTEKVYARGEILSVLESGYIVRVIDYGDIVNVTRDKLKMPMAAMMSKKRFAFPVRFLEGRQRFQHQRLMVDFVSEPNEAVQLVKTCDQTCTPITDFEITKFEASVATILNKSCYFVQLKLPAGLTLKKEDLTDISRFEIPSRLKPGLMFVVEENEQPKKRGLVIQIDEKLGMLVAFMPDLGVFKTLIIPKKPRLIPYCMAMLPAQTVFIRVAKILTNEAKFIDSFCQKAVYTFEIKSKPGENISHDVEISLGGAVLATGKIFTGMPNLKTFDLSFWSIYSEPKTPVKVLKANVAETVDVVLHPAHNLLHCKKMLDTVTDDGCLTTMPAVNDIVIFTMANKTNIRCIVIKVDAKNVEVSDLDTNVKYITDISSLKKASELIKNVPVYTIAAPLIDCPSEPNPTYLTQFFDLGHLKRRELVLMYAGHPMNGVQLLLGYGADSLAKKMAEFITEKKKEVIEKLEQEEKARLRALADEEAIRIKVRIQQEQAEALARKQQEQAEALARKQQEQAEALAREEEEKLRKAKELTEAKAKLHIEIPKPAQPAAKPELSKLELLKAAMAEEEERLRKEEAERLRKEAEMSPLPNGILFDDLQPMLLPVGKVCEILILDVMPDKNMMAVCEYNVANLTFVEEIITIVESYISSIDTNVKKGYKPCLREMCLGLYDEDGLWYRAVCIERPTPAEYKLNLIDFGTMTVVTSDKIMAFPEVLMKPPPRTHLALVKGMTKEQISATETYTKKKFMIESCEGGFCDISPA